MDEEVRAGVMLVRTTDGRFHRRYLVESRIVDDERCSIAAGGFRRAAAIELTDVALEAFCPFCYPRVREALVETV